MVATGPAALDVGDHRAGGNLGGDADHRTDLLDGAGLEADMADPGGVQFDDEVDGLLQFGDAGADHQAVDRRTGRTGLLHQAFSADLQLPQIRVEEQGVELHGAARLQQGTQFSDAPVEDRLGHLTAAGQLRPVPGVGGRRHDTGVDGRRRHSREQDRRAPGEPGELGGQLHRPIGQAHQRRRVTRPRQTHLGRRAHGEQIALTAARRGGHDPQSQPPDHRRGDARQDVAGSQVENPAGAGLGDLGDGLHPVDLLHQHRLGHPAGQFDVEPDRFGPSHDDVDAVGQPWGVEADFHRNRVEHRIEHRTAAHLALALVGFGVGDLAAVQLEAGQLLGRAGDDDRAPAVADRQRRRFDGANLVGEVVEQPGDAFGFGIGHRHHRSAITQRGDAATAGHQRADRTDQLGQGEQFHVAGATGAQRLHGEHALRVAGHRHRRGDGEIQALAGQRPDRRNLGQQDPGQRHCGRGQLAGRGDGIAGGQRPNPAQRLEADRPHHHEFVRDRLEQQVGLSGDPRQLRFDAGHRDEFLEADQPGAGALAAEDHRIGLAGIEAVHQRMAAVGVLAGGQPVVVVDRHLVSPALIGFSQRCKSPIRNGPFEAMPFVTDEFYARVTTLSGTGGRGSFPGRHAICAAWGGLRFGS